MTYKKARYVMDNQEYKEYLAKEIGVFFGDYYKDGNTHIIDNYEKKFKYNNLDDLLCDWVCTLLEYDGVNKQDYNDNSYAWNTEAEYIVNNCGAKIRNIRVIHNKNGVKYMAVQNIPSPTRKGKTTQRSLGTYDKIVDAYIKVQGYDL